MMKYPFARLTCRMTSPASPLSTFSLRKLKSWWFSGNNQPVRSLQHNHCDDGDERDNESDDEGDDDKDAGLGKMLEMEVAGQN